MKKPYLTPAGRKWLKARYAQLADEGTNDLPGAIGAELLTHEAAVIAPPPPPRKRGRPPAQRSRMDDEFAVGMAAVRCVALVLKGEKPDFGKVLRSVARELDTKLDETGRTGDPEARYKRLRRRHAGNLSPGVVNTIAEAERNISLLAKARAEHDSVRRKYDDLVRQGPEIERKAKALVDMDAREREWAALRDSWERSVKKYLTDMGELLSPQALKLTRRQEDPGSDNNSGGSFLFSVRDARGFVRYISGPSRTPWWSCRSPASSPSLQSDALIASANSARPTGVAAPRPTT